MRKVRLDAKLMQLSKRFLLLLFILSVSSCANSRFRPLQGSHDKRVERLQSERDKLTRQTDPVDRTKTEIKMADLILSLVTDAANAGDVEIIEQRLNEYVATIKDAHQTMINTGRDAHRKPGGFKDLEIALRRQVRQLDDIGRGLPFDQREPINKAREEASLIRDEMLKALFGEANAPTRRS